MEGRPEVVPGVVPGVVPEVVPEVVASSYNYRMPPSSRQIFHEIGLCVSVDITVDQRSTSGGVGLILIIMLILILLGRI
jgi:uncharacterized membrane protein